MELWPHQERALTALKQSVAQGIKRIVLASPTGSGKTRLAASIVEGAIRKGNRMAFCVPAISLVDQTYEAFYDEGIRDISIIQADHAMTDWSKPVQICSIQTLHRRKAYPEAQVVVIDECHVLHTAAKEWLHSPAWQNVPFIGLSATPWAKGMGKYFDSLLIAATTRELIDGGFLSPFRVFATGHPDLRDVKTVAGDYHEGQLSTAMQQGSLTADIVETWKKLWGKDKTLCFAVDCAHAQALQARFQEAGISCAYQDAATPLSERAEIKRKFHNGDVQIISNVGTMTTGVDYDVRCLILARPTKSKILYTQILGRALRVADGKEYALILDHSNSTQTLGFVTDIHQDKLDDGKSPDKNATEIKTPPLPKECQACGFLKPARTKICPNCGFEAKPVNGVHEQDGELVEVTNGMAKPKKSRAREFTMDEKVQFFAELKAYAADKGYKPGWAAAKYRERFEVWPNDYRLKSAAPIPPSATTLSWIRSRQIAWAKSKRRAENDNGNGHALTEREEKIVANVRNEFAPSTLMTDDDLKVDW